MKNYYENLINDDEDEDEDDIFTINNNGINENIIDDENEEDLVLGDLKYSRYDLVKFIHNKLYKDRKSISKVKIDKIIKCQILFFQEMFKNDCVIEIRGFGTFYSRIIKGRVSNWNLNKEHLSKEPKPYKIFIPDRKTIAFKPSKVIKENINNKKEKVQFYYKNTKGDNNEK